MKTKNIFKALALAILMPALLLNTACNSEIINNENTDVKGFALPVTVNVSRQGDDPATKATFDGSKLNFSAGDKLFVRGNYNSGKKYAGTLDYVSATGIFSGTIYTQNEWENSADALFSSAESIYATLLPAGYDSYNFLSIDNNGTTEVAYDDRESISRANAFVASATAKKTGVEQLSWERAGSYSDGFALAPRYAVLNFTISGLTAGAKDVTLKVTDGNAYSVTGSVTPNASGVATFAIGVPDYTNIQDVANNLTVGTANFTLPSNIDFYAGNIYNISRSAAPAPVAAPFSVSSTKQVYFAPGNLRAKYKDGTWTWSFSPNQWSYVGNASNNTNINGNGTVSAGGELYVDLFGWVGNSSTVLTGAIAKYGISNSTTSSDYSTVAGEALKSDWSVVANAANLDGHNDWRTLTGGNSGEWKYLLETRSASTVSGTANARYCKATVNSVPGLVLFPDSYTHPTGVTAPTNINFVPAAFTSNSWSGGDWTAMETVGCVFLPAAGYRSGASVSEDGTEGWYWSSTSHAEDAGWAGRLYFWKGDVNGWAYKQVFRGHSVRLVRDAN